jgi:multicomponent Na+:H+ antiporter subunit F
MMEQLPIVILALGLTLTFVRLIRGPSLSNRVVAFDLMTTIGIGVIAVYSVMTNQPVYLDIAIVLALISFLGTVAFAYYLERTHR